VIDDFSEAGHNDCTSTPERIDTGGLDAVASMIRAILRLTAAGDENARATFSDESKVCVPLHPDFSSPQSRSLKGKVFDLSKAYRQLARNSDA
jgi:hypothetical protein